MIADLECRLPFADNSVEYVHSKSVLEHVDNFSGLMAELHRVLKPDGVAELAVPHFSSPLGHSDFTHRRSFGYYTFDYFAPIGLQAGIRKVPDFYTDFKFLILSKRLRFQSALPLVHRVLKWVERLVNHSERWAYFYESTLCYLVPCYSLHVRLSPMKDGSGPAGGGSQPVS